MREGLKRFARRLAWILAVFFALVGASMMVLDVSALGGLLVLAGAVVMAPPVDEALTRALGEKWWSGRAVGVLCILFAAPVVVSMTQPTAEEFQAISAEREHRQAEKVAAAAEANKQRDAQAEQRRQEKLVADQRAADEKRARDCSDTAMAYIMSRRFVERALQAPASAKFPSYHDDGVHAAQAGECRFRVTAYVDAQNSFGAMLRTRYSIDMEYFPSSKNWRGSNLKM